MQTEAQKKYTVDARIGPETDQYYKMPKKSKSELYQTIKMWNGRKTFHHTEDNQKVTEKKQ